MYKHICLFTVVWDSECYETQANGVSNGKVHKDAAASAGSFCKQASPVLTGSGEAGPAVAHG